MKRTLALAKETLVELSADDLRRAAAGTGDPTELCNPCIFTWSCDNSMSLKCG